MRRRDFLRITAAGSALIGGPGLVVGCGDSESSGASGEPGAAFFGLGSPDPLRVAEAAGAWIRAHAVEARGGLTWPAVPGESESASLNLYSGTPGVILFLLELHHATGNQAYLDEAVAGAFLLQGAYTEYGGWPAAAGSSPQDPAITDPGLYTGQAGAAFALMEVYRATGRESQLAGAGALLNEILGRAMPVGDGLAWFDEDPQEASYDIISGSAGIGLTLLYANELFVEPALLEVASLAGTYLVSRGRPQGDGLKWPISEANPRLMPNFSHGTAGVAYFLARLAQATGDDSYLQAAIQGARYLQAVSLCRDGGCRVFHHEPEGEDLYYLGWCHGPPGTARLYYELSRATGDPSWMDWVLQGAKAVRDQGIPENRPEGFWNNVSQCCGDAGVGDFFLALAGVTDSAEHADFARHLGDYVAGGALEADAGVQWLQAEHRTRPDFLQAQTGWMQGAAGVGVFFLHLDGLAKGRPSRIVFPDSPWEV